MIKTADFRHDGRRADGPRRSARIVVITPGCCCALPHQPVYWSISASIAKDIHHIRFKLFKSYLSVYVHLARKKRKRTPCTEQQNDLVFLIPRNYVQISSRRTRHGANAHVQTAPVGDCLNRWHFEPYYMLAAQRGTQQASRRISLLLPSLPPLPPHCHSHSSFIQFGIEDAGAEEEG